MLALQLYFLTDRVAAKRVDDDEHAEWPPHFARVYYAMAAACFEANSPQAERQALERLAALGPPVLRFREQAVHERSFLAYVPANDVLKNKKDKEGQRPANLESVLAQRPRHERRFTSAWLAHPIVEYRWPDANLELHELEALKALCSRVSAVGHSSSLVRLLVSDSPFGDGDDAATWEPASTGDLLMRVAFPGLLDLLETYYQRYRSSKLRGYLPSHPQLYRRSASPSAPPPILAVGAFGPAWSLWISSGPALPILACTSVATLLHKTILAHWQRSYGEIPQEISGHDPQGRPASAAHMACFALPAVGHRHSTGTLLGVGVALPHNVDASIRQRLLSILRGPLQLRSSAGAWELEFIGRDFRSDLPITVWARRWEKPSKVWASVTPVVLDRHPDEPFGPEAEGFLRLACRNAGLPDPEHVVVRPTSVVSGVPPARDFPRYPPDQPSVRVHAVLVFKDEVSGPVLVGRGRYRGMGLFLPQEL